MGFFGGGSSSSSGSSDSQSPTPDFNLPSSQISSPSGFSPAAGSSSSSATRNRIQQSIAQSSNLANAKFLISKVNETCFDHCVTAPGSNLSSKEQTCLSSCMEKYIEAWNSVNRTYVGRLQREGAQLPLGGL